MHYKDFEYVAKKLGIDKDTLTEYFNLPLKSHHDYPNQLKFFDIGAKILKFIGIERSIKR